MSPSLPMALQWKLSLWKYQLTKWLKRSPFGRRFNLKTVLFLTLVKIVVVAVYFLFKWNFICSNLPVQNVLKTVCEQYKNGDVVGDICDAICDTDADFEVDSCQTWHGGKEIVFSAILKGKKVFVKGRRRFIESDPDEQLFWTRDSFGKKHLPDFETFEKMVTNFLRNNFDIEMAVTDDDVFDKLWDIPIREMANEKDSKQTEAAMKNLWALVQDNEYVFTKIFQEFELFPKVYGTCGGLYAVENLEPLSFPSLFGTITFSQFSVHASVALAILDFLDELESIFRHPVHLCDVKASHFGISDDGKIKFLDLDAVFQKSVLDKTMSDNTVCTKHSDCHFFDCKGQCDLIEGKCINGAVNNNLQVVCEKVFIRNRFSDHPDRLFSAGFLESKHSTRRLEKVLNHCANPTDSKDDTRTSANPDTKRELHSALQEILDIAEKLEAAADDVIGGKKS